MGSDFVTLGIPLRPWDLAHKTPGREKFNYFDVERFEPDHWKNEYANPAFDRMTERDAAWMARVLSGFTPDLVQALASMGQFSHPDDTAFLASVLEGRLEKILQRYLTHLSPVSSVHIEAGDQLCAVDLAERRELRPPEAFRYSAGLAGGAWLSVTRRPHGEILRRPAARRAGRRFPRRRGGALRARHRPRRRRRGAARRAPLQSGRRAWIPCGGPRASRAVKLAFALQGSDASPVAHR